MPNLYQILTVNTCEALHANFWQFPLVFWCEIHIVQPLGKIQHMSEIKTSSDGRCQHLCTPPTANECTKPANVVNCCILWINSRPNKQHLCGLTRVVANNYRVSWLLTPTHLPTHNISRHPGRLPRLAGRFDDDDDDLGFKGARTTMVIGAHPIGPQTIMLSPLCLPCHKQIKAAQVDIKMSRLNL